MFKLQRLEITGFKSFADYTDLVFTGNGITAIVGPNGCGKSNVADAISWVLGEQKVKNLRGGEMKDVIFQGAKNRLPSGMAEVVLHMMRDETVEEEPDIEDIDSKRSHPSPKPPPRRSLQKRERRLTRRRPKARGLRRSPWSRRTGPAPRPRRSRARPTSATGGRAASRSTSRRARASRSRAASTATARAST